MNKLNITFYTDSFLPAMDGVVTSIKNSAAELERRGHNVYIFAASNISKYEIGKEGFNADHVFPIHGVKFRKYPQYSIPIYPNFKQLKFLKETDIVHAHTPLFMGLYALMLAKGNRLPIVGTFHTLINDNKAMEAYISSKMIKKLAKRYSWAYLRFFYNSCNAVIAPSAPIKQLLEKKGITNVYDVANGIDMKKFNSNVNGKKERESLLGGNFEKIILYIGRISKEKRLEVLLKVAKRTKDKRLLFAIGGAGPALKYYQALAKKYMLNNVKFLGFIENEMLPKYYKASDVFCIPSTFETQGMVALEAMAVGKPVVGADKLALSNLIENGKNGEKFKPNDFIECERKIEKVINNIANYNQMVETAKFYSIEKTVDRLLNIYNNLLSQ
ncbi:MAG: glycosyltransferase [Candidatus Micrarchaeaceae archaeon]